MNATELQPAPAVSRRPRSFECHNRPISAVSGNYFAVIDASYAHRAVNEAYCKAHSKSLEDILGRTVAEVWGETLFRAILREPLARCLRGEEVHYAAWFEFHQGGPRHFEVSMYPTGQGGVVEAVVVTRDVTDSRRTEQEVHLMLELMRAVKEAPDFNTLLTVALHKICQATGWVLGHAWIPSANGTVLESSPAAYVANPALERLLAHTQNIGLHRGEGLPGRVWESKHPLCIRDLLSDPAFPDGPVVTSLGLKVAIAIPVIAGEDVVAVMEFFIAGSDYDDDQLMRVVSAVATQLGTVFQRKLAEEQLDRFFTRSLDMHCIAGFDGFLKRVNPAWEKTLGYSAEELMARPFLDLVHPEERQAVAKQFESLRQGFDAMAFEMRCHCKDGDWKQTLWNATPLARQEQIIATGRDITQRKRAEEALRQSEEHYRELFHQAYEMQQSLRHLSDKVLRVQEEERTRLSRELHDEVGQALTAVNVQLALLRHTLPEDDHGWRRKVEETQQIIEHTMDAVHNFARDLRPAMLDDLGLLPALRSYTKSFAERTGVRASFQATDHAELLDRERKTVIYRVVQEALTNVAKHACARRADVQIRKRGGRICVEVTDDGRGFTLAGTNPASGEGRLGLLGMQERVRLVNGQLCIRSEPGKGTSIQVSIPLS